MTLTGRLHRQTIELDRPLDWPDGTEVEIEVRRFDKLAHLQQAIGRWPEDPPRDETLDRIQQERHAALMQEPKNGVSS